MERLAKHNVLLFAGQAFGCLLIVAHQFDPNGPPMIALALPAVTIVLILLQVAYGPPLWPALKEAGITELYTLNRMQRGRAFFFAGFMVLSIYVACLFFLGERLGWSLKQAGAVGLLLCTSVCLAGAVADWRAEPDPIRVSRDGVSG